MYRRREKELSGIIKCVNRGKNDTRCSISILNECTLLKGLCVSWSKVYVLVDDTQIKLKTFVGASESTLIFRDAYTKFFFFKNCVR